MKRLIFNARVSIGYDKKFVIIDCDQEIVKRDYEDAPDDWLDHERTYRSEGAGVYSITGYVEYEEETARYDHDNKALYDFEYTTSWEKVL